MPSHPLNLPSHLYSPSHSLHSFLSAPLCFLPVLSLSLSQAYAAFLCHILLTLFPRRCIFFFLLSPSFLNLSPLLSSCLLTPIQSHLSPHRHSILIYSLPCSILHLFLFSLLLLSVAYSFLYSFLLYLSFVFLILVHSRSFPNSPRSRTHIYILIISIKSASHVSTFAISLCNLIFLTSSPGISAFFAPYSLHSSLNSSIRSLDRHISIPCLSTFTLFLRDLNILSPHVVLPHFLRFIPFQSLSCHSSFTQTITFLSHTFATFHRNLIFLSSPKTHRI